MGSLPELGEYARCVIYSGETGKTPEQFAQLQFCMRESTRHTALATAPARDVEGWPESAIDFMESLD